MFKTFSVNDFSGGLNTAVAESLLDSKFSPDLSNVDFTDTGAITRRNGFAAVSGTIAASPVKALYRYHQRDGDKYWLSVCGTALFAISGDAAVLNHRIEAEDVTITGTYTTATWSGFSGGYATMLTGVTATMTIPQSDAITVKVYANNVGASLKIDAGAYVTATSTHTWTGLSLASHTLTVKPKALNTSSMAVSAGATGYGLSENTSRRTLPDGAKVVRMSFFDPTGGTWTHDAGVGISSTDHSDHRHEGYLEIVFTPTYSVYYVGDDKTGNVLTSITRTLGWHDVEFGISTSGWVKIDGQTVWTGDSSAYTSTVMCFIKQFNGAGTANTHYFDGLYVDNVLVDDIDDVSNWTISWGINAYSTYEATGAYYLTSPRLPVDYFDVSYGVSATWTNIHGVFSASTEQVGFSTLNDVCYLNTSYDTMQSYNGTVLASVAASGGPAGGFLIEFKRRLWSAGDYSDPAKLYYTAVDEPHDWDGGGEIYLAGKDSGGRCTGLIPWQGKILYFSDSRIYSIDPTGADTGWTAAMSGYSSVSWSLGCIAPKSLVQSDTALIFLSADGVRAYGYVPNLYTTDGSGLLDLSLNIRPTLDTISDAMKEKVAGAFYNGRYWMACALGSDTDTSITTNNTILVFDMSKQAWTKYTGMDISCFHVTRGDEYGLYAGDATTGKIYRMDYGTNDNGDSIILSYKTPQMAPGGFETIKKFSHLHIAAESDTVQEMTVGVNTDDVECADQTVSITNNTAAQPLRAEISSRGRSIQYEFTSSGAAQPLTVSRLTTTYYPKKVR